MHVTFPSTHTVKEREKRHTVRMDEAISLSAGSADGRMWPVGLVIREGLPTVIRVQAADSDWREFEAATWFSCLLEVRLALEREGLLLCCQGSRPDVHPSGMQLQMELGRCAYRLNSDSPASEEDVVDIFAPAELSEVVSVAEQRAAVLKFFNSAT